MSAHITRKGYFALIALALVLGAVLRFGPVLSADFPLNDGGLFEVMIEDLEANSFRLPDFTSYNDASIPYAYPPLALYLAGLIHWTTRADLLTLLRILPAIFSLATIVVASRLMLALTGSGFVSAVGGVFFAILPRSTLWLVMGGGLTRSVGFLFALLALLFFVHALGTGRPSAVIGSAVFTALTVASHLEMAWFVAYSMLLFLVLSHRKLPRLSMLLAYCCLAAALLAPWLVAIISRHGLDPFLDALHHGTPLTVGVAVLVAGRVSAEPFVPLLALLALLAGLVLCLQRKFFLVFWLAAMFFLDPRSALTTATLPVATLSAAGLEIVVTRHLFSRAAPDVTAALCAETVVVKQRSSSWALRLATLLVLYGFLGSLTVLAAALKPLTPDERQAMAWVRAHLPPDVRFASVPADAWQLDSTSEWFPALTSRRNVSTVQGYEWMPGRQFSQRAARHKELQDCGQQGVACLDRWIASSNERAGYVYVPKERQGSDKSGSSSVACCVVLARQISSAPNYQVVYENSGALIARILDGSGS